MTERKSPEDPVVGASPAAPASPGASDERRERSVAPEDLKAFTHPLRMAMFSALRDHGPATATQLARRLGESTGQTSYHLRQLERHGFVEDDPDHTGGRERWWRSASFNIDDPVMLADPQQAPAVRAMFDLMIGDRVRVLRQFVGAVMAGAITLDESVVSNTTTLEMTPDETRRMIEATQAVFDEYGARAKARVAAGDTAGRRRVRLYFDVLPLPPDELSGGM
ncbi:MAG: helix-turn-helix domain-containing protein [Micrococcales bacterium]|nr:helix-turn-helix domain-containing protein [Micrococcales bacterium]